jgi:hypothetical protein
MTFIADIPTEYQHNMIKMYCQPITPDTYGGCGNVTVLADKALDSGIAQVLWGLVITAVLTVR